MNNQSNTELISLISKIREIISSQIKPNKKEKMIISLLEQTELISTAALSASLKLNQHNGEKNGS
jgi:hypothetical protein